MYLLDTETFGDLMSRDQSRAIFTWLEKVKPSQLFVSVISIGLMADGVEDKPTADRGHWRRLLAEARHEFAVSGGVIVVDEAIVDAWAPTRSLELTYDDDGAPVGDEELLVAATAVARDLTLLVTTEQGFHAQLADRTTLALLVV